MNVSKISCPNCGAELDIQERMAFCSYCGGKILIDDGNINVNHTYKKVDEARIKENERKREIRLKELENDQKDKKRDVKIGLLGLGILIFIMFFSIGMGIYYEKSEQPKDNEIVLCFSDNDLIGDNYEQVIRELEDLGFSNIETAKQQDLVTGWITKVGDVARISINGDSDFDEGDIFPKDAKVLVTYHTFKE